MVKLGSIVSGVVEGLTSSAVVINVNSKAHLKGMIFNEHLADHHERAALLKSILKPGYKFDQLLVLGLGVLSMAVQAVVRMTGNADTAAQNFFLLDKDVQFCTSFLAFFILFVQSILCSFRYVMSFLLCNEDVDFMN
ncbi:hypothetical protein ERO13_D05G345851v2 [Gossypium hirsutum]|nr:hypothetical protein ERO13_D05G345851v2 [Gossypium hirsutum]